MKNKEHNIGTVVYLNPESKWAQGGDDTNPKGTAGVVVKNEDCSGRWMYIFWKGTTNIQNCYEKDGIDLLTEKEYLELNKFKIEQ